MRGILKELAENENESNLETLIRIRRTTPVSIIDVLAWISALGVFAVTVVSAIGLI